MLLQDDKTRIGYAEGTSEEEAIRSHLQDVLPKSLYNTLATAKQDSKEFKSARSEAITDFGMDADTIQTAIDALRNTREQYRLGELVKQGVKKLTKSADDVIERKPRPEEPTTFADKIKDREEDLDDLIKEYEYVKKEFDSLRRAGVEVGDKRYDELIEDLAEIKSDFKTIQSQLKELGVSPSKKNIEEKINKVPMAEGGETPEKKSLLQDDSVMIAVGMPTHTMPDGTVMPGETHEEGEMIPDNEMENNYIDFILDEALTDEEENMLMSKLEQDEELSMLFDKVIEVASEFAGSGPVEGPGTGVSDSIPARLSDGEFVFTAKAVEEIGADNLMAMMKEAEMKADERQGMYAGGLSQQQLMDENKAVQYGGQVQPKMDVTDEINKSMLGYPVIR